MKIVRIALLLACVLVFGSCHKAPVEEKKTDWRRDWFVKNSFQLKVDSEGYNFPTSIAFVPHPDSGAKDPLYFITELRGKIKVVTNDRTVYTFSENPFNLSSMNKLPLVSAEFGMGGICLDPQHGYVFATFAYHDSNGILYNNIARYSTQPETFALKPVEVLTFTDIFSSFESGVSHQIGNCRIVDDQLYVSVGDGHQSYYSQRTDSILGKILRMTLDGKPVPDNPFYQDQDVRNPRNFIYAYGLRNPFAIVAVKDKVFVADNGQQIDRFLQIRKGQNYGWNGSDLSIGAVSNGVISPAIGPVQMDYCPSENSVLPEDYKGGFFLAGSGAHSGYGPGKGVLHLQFDEDKQQMTAPPEYIVQYRGKDYQAVTGVAVGPEGLYFVPLYPVFDSKSVIMKVLYTPGEINQTADEELDPTNLLGIKGCLECHNLNETQPKIGPSLKREELVSRIQERLRSKEYRKSVDQLNRITKEPYSNYVRAREEVLRARDMEQVRIWLKYHLLEPRFDNPKSQMPNMNLTETQAVQLAAYLAKPAPREGVLWKAEEVFRVIFWKWRYKQLTSFVAGFCSAVLVACTLTFVYFRRNKRK